MSIHGLTSMKRTKKDRKNSDHDVVGSSHEDFPFGLSISLEDETLTKLGMTKLPAVGTELIVAGIGRVTSISERSDTDRKKSRSVTIQLEQLDIGPLKAGAPKTSEDAISEAIKGV